MSLLLISFFGLLSCVYAQEISEVSLHQHFKGIDVETERDLVQLTDYLIAPYESDSLKFRSIYVWITHHIKYDLKASGKNKKRINQSNEDILRRKKAICWGYATLLKSMCEHAGISVEIISGYVKDSFDQVPNLRYPTHAWNAVQLNGKWYLVDVTWDNTGPSGRGKYYQERYYCACPEFFVSSHLPTIPQWQLLECAVSIQDFRHPIKANKVYPQKEGEDCEEESSQAYLKLNPHEKRLQEAIQTYQFNPTEMNKRDLAHHQIQYQDYLSEIALRLQSEQQLDSLLIIQKQMIELCETASELADLFNTQKENCAYNYFNHAVALYQLNPDKKEDLKEVLHYFEQAQMQLSALPQNIFVAQALEQCTTYQSYLKKELKKY